MASRDHKLEVLSDGGLCCRCKASAGYLASYLMMRRAGEERVKHKYCWGHAMAFAHKYGLANWRGRELHLVETDAL